MVETGRTISPAEERAREKAHNEEVKKWEKYWDQKAKEKDWDSVVGDPAVYRYAGQVIKR